MPPSITDGPVSKKVLSFNSHADSCYNQPEAVLLYLEYKPAAQLTPFVKMLWYARAPNVEHKRERILPSGCVEVIINLARDFLTDCREGQPERRDPPALVVGARSVYEIVDTADMASLIGIHFHPGGFAPFIGDAADLFTNRSQPLDDLYGPSALKLRDRLREIVEPSVMFQTLEDYLLRRLSLTRPRQAMVDFALQRFGQSANVCSVRETARLTGWSERRFSQVFREEVGLAPKAWVRLQRFQRAVKQLHAGVDLPWTRLALDCGFYDQSHFANEFRAFSGIDATTYSASRTLWANHVPVD